MRDPRALEPLVLYVTTFHRVAAGEALGILGDNRAIPVLKQALERNYLPPAMANIALARLGDITVLPTLLEYYRDGLKSGGLIEAIGAIGDSTAVESLQWKLTHKDLYPEERECIKKALDDIGTPDFRLDFHLIGPLLVGRMKKGIINLNNAGGEARTLNIRSISENLELMIESDGIPPVLKRGETAKIPIKMCLSKGGTEITAHAELSFTDLLSRQRSVVLNQVFSVRYPRVFISYIRENAGDASRLIDALKFRIQDLEVWRDVSKLLPGDRWKAEIRKAIREGDFFVACFSEEYEEREKTYMNEELLIAVEELRQRRPGQKWFIPVKFSPCYIPEYNIGAGETLDALQYIELDKNWEDGINQIIAVILGKSKADVK
jgi:hypothetical protein